MRYAFAEIWELFDYIETDLINEIPATLMYTIYTEALCTYEKHLDPNLSFEEQTFSSETEYLLTILMIYFWSESDEEREDIMASLPKD